MSAVGRSEMLGVSLSAKRSHWHGAEGKLDFRTSHILTAFAKSVSPHSYKGHMKSDWVWIARPLRSPFSSVGIERKVSHVVVAGLFPMVDRQRLTIVLAIETGPHAFYAARLSRMVLREDDLQPVSPKHQNVSPFRAEETTKAQ